MNYIEMQEMEKIRKLKEEKKCMCCEIVIPQKIESAPIVAIYGKCGDIELAMLVNKLEEIAEKLKKNFPEVKMILPFIEKGKLKEEYKRVERWQRI